MSNYHIGDLITFSYPAVHQQGTRAHDKFPKVLVLHPNWGGLVHGLNFNYLTEDEINTIRMILDPMFEMKYREALQRKNPGAFAELDKILTGKVSNQALKSIETQQRTAQHMPGFATPSGVNSRMAKITTPRAFYLNIIRPFITSRNWEPYRLYTPGKMTNVRVLQSAAHMTGQDAYAKYKAQQADKATQVGQKLSGQEPDKKSVMQWFKDKFQHMRGPKFPGFQGRGPGALPGTRDDGGEE